MKVAKMVLGGVCLIVGVVVLVDWWSYWAYGVGGVLIGFSYVWLWLHCGK